MSTRDLPRGDSPDIHLAVATPAELRSQWNVNASEWRGPLSLEAYLRREEFLINQSLTEDAGLTPWMLVYQPDANGSRRVLCGCETLRKRALVARDGGEEEVICHGVASVFCAAENRGKGYAGRMIHELAQKARGWQAGKMQVSFSILFSDIGKVGRRQNCGRFRSSCSRAGLLRRTRLAPFPFSSHLSWSFDQCAERFAAGQTADGG